MPCSTEGSAIAMGDGVGNGVTSPYHLTQGSSGYDVHLPSLMLLEEVLELRLALSRAIRVYAPSHGSMRLLLPHGPVGTSWVGPRPGAAAPNRRPRGDAGPAP